MWFGSYMCPATIRLDPNTKKIKSIIPTNTYNPSFEGNADKKILELPGSQPN